MFVYKMKVNGFIYRRKKVTKKTKSNMEMLDAVMITLKSIFTGFGWW